MSKAGEVFVVPCIGPCLFINQPAAPARIVLAAALPNVTSLKRMLHLSPIKKLIRLQLNTSKSELL
jgi:hypothetical protein